MPREMVAPKKPNRPLRRSESYIGRMIYPSRELDRRIDNYRISLDARMSFTGAACLLLQEALKARKL